MEENRYKEEDLIHPDTTQSHSIDLSEEFREFARYLRLSMLRDRNILPPAGLKELDDIINVNERASALEHAKQLLKENKITEEEYYALYDSYRKELKDAIIEANNRRELAEEEEVQEEQKSDEQKDLLPKLYRDYARYLRLSILRDKNVLPPSGLKELEEIVATNELAASVENAKRLLKDKLISEEDFEELKNKYRKELMDEAVKVTAAKNEENVAEVEELEEKKNEEPPKKDYTDEDLNKLENDILNENNELNKSDEVNNDKWAPIKNDPILNFIYDTFKNNEDKDIKPEIVAADDETKRLLEENEKLVEELERNVKEDFFNEEKNEEPIEEEKEEKVEDKTEKVTSHEEEKGLEISKEFKDLARYFKLRILRDRNGSLTEEEQKEYDNLVATNERAEAIEATENELKKNNISKETFDKFYNYQKQQLMAAVSETAKRKKELEKQAEAEEHDEPEKEDADDTLRLMRETVDHYIAYQKGLNKLGVSNMNELMEMLSAKGKKEEATEDKKLIK
jgi:hypothetical protein